MLTRILVFLGLIVFSNHVIAQEVESKEATKSQAELKAQDSAKTVSSVAEAPRINARLCFTTAPDGAGFG